MSGQGNLATHRIQVDVPADRPEVALVLDQFALEPPLKEVSWPVMAFGVPVGIAGYEVLHAP